MLRGGTALWPEELILVLAFLGSLGTPEILLIFALMLLLFGARKLPEMARGMGQAIQEFRKGTRDIVQEIENADRDVRTAPSKSRTATPKAPAPVDAAVAERETAEATADG